MAITEAETVVAFGATPLTRVTVTGTATPRRAKARQ
jgi:hypothetical protein